MRISVIVPGVGARTYRVHDGGTDPVSHAPVDPYFCVVQCDAIDESLSYVVTVGLKRSSRGGAAADVGLVGLDM
jgi:hypothetical protein